MRFETIFAEVRRLVEEGSIGRVTHSMFSFYQPLPPGERIWYAHVGVLRDMLVHVFELVAHLSDATPVRVRASTGFELGYAGERREADMDLICFGILVVKLPEIGMAAPAVGMNVYMIEGSLGNLVTLQQVFRGVVWFIVTDAVTPTRLVVFPALSLWLPSLVE